VTTLRRSLAFSFGQTYGGYVLGVIGTLFLARLLTPAEFGVFAIGTSVVMLLDAVRDFGVSTYLVQERDLTQDRVRSAFTVAAGISVLCALGLLAAAHPVAAFYGNAGLAAILLVLAANFIVSVLGMPSMALLRRDLQFDALAAINLLSAFLQLGAVITLALLGFSYMSLAWSTLFGTALRTVAAFAWRPVPWAFRPSLSAWRGILAFGGYSTATALINVFHEALPQLIIGRILGVIPVGLYGRATMICALPDRLFIGALQPVVLPVLTERVRTGRDLKGPYLLSMTYMSALLWPGLLCLVLLADPVVLLLLGPQWDAVPPLVRIMALGSLSLFPAFMTYPMMVALGRIRDTLTMSVISLPPSILVIYLFSHGGIEMVAGAQLVNAPLQVFVAITFIRRHIDLSWWEIAEAVRPSLVVALCTAAGPALVLAMAGFRFDLPLPAFFAALAAGAAGWLAGIAVTDHPMLQEVKRAARLVGSLGGQRE
jgi:O-antigen/teichoic acid export membrane protein